MAKEVLRFAKTARKVGSERIRYLVSTIQGNRVRREEENWAALDGKGVMNLLCRCVMSRIQLWPMTGRPDSEINNFLKPNSLRNPTFQ